MSAADLKNKGNAAFSAGDYKTSIDFFSQAIQLDPNNHILYSNRSDRSSKKILIKLRGLTQFFLFLFVESRSGSYASLKDFENALKDAEKCISLKSEWAKVKKQKIIIFLFPCSKKKKKTKPILIDYC